MRAHNRLGEAEFALRVSGQHNCGDLSLSFDGGGGPNPTPFAIDRHLRLEHRSTRAPHRFRPREKQKQKSLHAEWRIKYTNFISLVHSFINKQKTTTNQNIFQIIW